MPRRNPPLPKAPPRRPSPKQLSGALARVRKFDKDYQKTERPFDPSRAPSWRGSSRDLVVNGLRPNASHLQKYGQRMSQWHSSQSDPIYAVGSFALSGKVHPSQETIEAAQRGLERISRDPRHSAKDQREAALLAQETAALLGDAAPGDLDAFTVGFLNAALFSSSDNSRDDGGDPLEDNYSFGDIDPKSVAALSAECRAFQEQNADALAGFDPTEAGADFWFTRCGHGVGYWDGDYPEPQATRLTEASKKFGEVDLYVGDDGVIYAMGYEDGKPRAHRRNGRARKMRKNAYELSFSPEFFFAEGEPYDYLSDTKRPISVWAAVEGMRLHDPKQWAELAKEVFGLDNPEYLTAETVMDKIQETNTCGTLSSPVDVYIDPEGYFTVDVYDEMRSNSRKHRRNSGGRIVIPNFDWMQIGGDMDPGGHGGLIATADGDHIELVEIQPVREYVGDGEAAEVGFPFWTKEAWYDADDLSPSRKEVQQALQSMDLDLAEYDADKHAVIIAEALMRYGVGSEEGEGGWSTDIVQFPVKWWGSPKPQTFEEYCGDEDDSFRTEVLEEEEDEDD